MHVVNVQTPATMALSFTVYFEDDYWTASCDDLPGLITCDKDPARLMTPMLQDAIFGWLDLLKERGELKATLVRLGVDPNAAEIGFNMSFHPPKPAQDEIRYALRAS